MESNDHFDLMTMEEFIPYLNKNPITRTVSRLQVHHTYIPNRSTRKGQTYWDTLKSMRDTHMRVNGWREIGQNITIFEDGMIAVSKGRDLNQIPAGIAGANTGAICIENIGNFNADGDIMSDAQKRSILRVYAALADKLHLPIDTSHIVYHAWYTPKGDRLGDYDPKRSSKTCPGTAFWGDGNTITAAVKGFLPDIKTELANIKNKTVVNEEDQPMTKEEKQAFDELKDTVSTQAETIKRLSVRLNIDGDQKYAEDYEEAVKAAKAAGAIKSSQYKSKPELNIIQMIYNMGLFGGKK